MDWPRAQRILIVAFLLVNAFFAYQIWGNPGQAGMALFRTTPDQVRLAREELERAGLAVNVEIPRHIPPAGALLIGREPAAEGEWVKVFFPRQQPVRRQLVWNGRPAAEYRSDTGALWIDQAGVIAFRVEHDQEEPPPVPSTAGAGAGSMPRSDPAAVRTAEDFLVRHGGLPPDARFDRVESGLKPGQVVVVYYQDVAGRPHFGGRLAVHLRELSRPGSNSARYAVTGMERAWFRVYGTAGEVKPVLPATSALLGLAGHIGGQNQGPVLRHAALGGLQFGYYSRPYNAERWEAPPIWRATLTDGRTYYINAWTGELEQ